MKIVNFDPKKQNPINNLSIVIVKERDFWILKKYLKYKRLKPEKIYKIFSFPEGYEELIGYYLKYKYYKQYTLNYDNNLILEWDKIVKLFNQGKYKCVIDILNEMEDVDLLLNIPLIKKNLEKIILKVEIPLIEQGVFLNVHYDKKKLGYNQVCLYDKFHIVDKFINIKFKSHNKWNNLNIYLNILTSKIPNDVSISTFQQDRLFFLSIFFYRIAEYYKLNGNYLVSYNILHRTIDMFLSYLCKKSNINDCGKYLMNKFDKLKTSSTSYSFTTIQEEAIKKLNMSRNKLYITHGLYSIQKEELNQMFVFIKKFIKEIDGNLWNNTLKDIRLTFKLHPLDLFINEPSFDTYFVEVN